MAVGERVGDAMSAPGTTSRRATLMRPKLRSRNRSGSPSGCGTENVLELATRYAELLGELFERLAGPEAFEHVFDAGAASLEDRGTKCAGGIRHYVRLLIGGHMDKRRIAVTGVLDSPQVRLDDLREDTLAASHHDELERRLPL